MPYPTPTRATPAGCLVGLLGLASIIYGAISTWGLFKAVDVPLAESDPELIMKLGLGSAIGVSLGLYLIRWSWHLTAGRNKS